MAKTAVSSDAATTAAAKPREASRLRDSCQACAASKVKCPKEKPSCSRCETRGIRCQYFVIKRPGRRRDSSKTENTTTTASSPAVQSLKPTDSNDGNDGNGPDSEGDMILALPPSAHGSSLPFNRSPDQLLGLLGSGGGNISNVPPALSPPGSIIVEEAAQEDFTLDDSLMSPLVNFETEMSDFDFFMSVMDNTHPYFLPTPESAIISPLPTTRRDIASLLIPGTNNTQPGSTNHSISSATSLSSPVLSFTPSDSHQMLRKPAIEAQCQSEHGSCFAQALDSLKHLLATLTPPSSPSSVRPSTSPQQSSNTTTGQQSKSQQHDVWAQGLLSESKTIIETTSNMLTCACCANDNFLLTIIGMTVLKLLARYAVMARPQGRDGGSAQPENKLTSSTARLARCAPSLSALRDDDDVVRMRAQLVLGELHPVRQLINELSPRLRSASEDVSSRGNETEATPASLSVAILHQIEGDLRRNFSRLSASIIAQLRQSY